MGDIDYNYAYARIGMALISAQRVEYVVSKIVDYLRNFDDFHELTTEKFLTNSIKINIERATLGQVFILLKLNPDIVIEKEFDKYKNDRNILVHSFWIKYLHTKSDKQVIEAVSFCNTFGKFSNKVERFFSGLLYKISEDLGGVDSTMELRKLDYEYFLESLKCQKLS